MEECSVVSIAVVALDEQSIGDLLSSVQGYLVGEGMQGVIHYEGFVEIAAQHIQVFYVGSIGTQARVSV